MLKLKWSVSLISILFVIMVSAHAQDHRSDDALLDSDFRSMFYFQDFGYIKEEISKFSHCSERIQALVGYSYEVVTQGISGLGLSFSLHNVLAGAYLEVSRSLENKKDCNYVERRMESILEVSKEQMKINSMPSL